ncbi:putative DnaJ domain, chaperone J-domain superfamily protein [Tanacetum coccineum]
MLLSLAPIRIDFSHDNHSVYELTCWQSKFHQRHTRLDTREARSQQNRICETSSFERLQTGHVGESKEIPRRIRLLFVANLSKDYHAGVATQQSTKAFSRTSREGRGDTSAWTDTPSDRAQKAKMNYLEAYNEAAALAAAGEQEKKTNNADAELVDKYNKAKRSKSLVEKHQEATRVRSKKKSKQDQDKQKQEWEGQHPWKPWDRDKDLTAGRQNVKLDAENMSQGLTSRFSSGSFQRNFL